MVISFHISQDGPLLIKENQEVDFKTVLSRKSVTNEVKIPLASDLQIDPKKIFLHLIKVVGDEVKKGEVIARKKTVLSQKDYVSPYSGLIKEINHNDGSLTLAADTQKEQVKNSYFVGTVAEIKKNNVKLKVKKAQQFALKEASSDFGGEFVVFEPSEDTALENFAKKVVFFDSISSIFQVKLEVIGALGFVTLQAPQEKLTLPFARLKNPQEWPTVKDADSKYCLIDKTSAIIYLYE